MMDLTPEITSLLLLQWAAFSCTAWEKIMREKKRYDNGYLQACAIALGHTRTEHQRLHGVMGYCRSLMPIGKSQDGMHGGNNLRLASVIIIKHFCTCHTNNLNNGKKRPRDRPPTLAKQLNPHGTKTQGSAEYVRINYANVSADRQSQNSSAIHSLNSVNYRKKTDVD